MAGWTAPDSLPAGRRLAETASAPWGQVLQSNTPAAPPCCSPLPAARTEQVEALQSTGGAVSAGPGSRHYGYRHSGAARADVYPRGSAECVARNAALAAGVSSCTPLPRQEPQGSARGRCRWSRGPGARCHLRRYRGRGPGTHRFLQDVRAPIRSAHDHRLTVVMQDLTLRLPPRRRRSWRQRARRSPTRSAGSSTGWASTSARWPSSRTAPPSCRATR